MQKKQGLREHFNFLNMILYSSKSKETNWEITQLTLN
jgi:hypothetical protein